MPDANCGVNGAFGGTPKNQQFSLKNGRLSRLTNIF